MVNTVWHKTCSGTAWWRSAITLGVVTLLVVASAELFGPTTIGGADRHAAHHMLAAASAGSAAVVDLDHPHVQRSESVAPPDVVAAAVLPRAATILMAFAAAVAVVAVWLSAARAAVVTLRGPPPPTPANHLSGWQLLIRFCIDRR